jgi:hypothetical protein
MIVRSRNILRLSGTSPEKAPEQKSKQHQAAAVFRRFFYVLHKLDLKDRLGRKSAALPETRHDN